MREPRTYVVYILASRSRALYIGVTSNLWGRLHQHKNRALPGHTARYRIDRLVYYETTDDVFVAIAREKQLKAFRRQKKVRLIESINPLWTDMAADWFTEPECEQQIPHPAAPGSG